MNPKENETRHDPLDALVDWDQHRSNTNAVQTPAIQATDIVQTFKRRRRNRAILSSSIALVAVGAFGIAITNSLNRPNMIQSESAMNGSSQPQPTELPREVNEPVDLQIAEVPQQSNSVDHFKSFNEQLAVVDSSLSGFHQLSDSVVRLNAIDHSSRQHQYRMQRNLAMLEILKSTLPSAN